MDGKIIGLMAFCLMVAVIASPANATSPIVDSVGISPAEPYASDDLTCSAHVSDSDGDLQYIVFDWFVNGGWVRTVNEGVSGHSGTGSDVLDSGYTEAGDAVRCEAMVLDAGSNSDDGYDEVTVIEEVPGSSPEVDSLGISPTDPEDWDDLTCSVEVSDIDGDLEEVRFRWYRNTVVIRTVYRSVSGYSDVENDVLGSSATKEGDQIVCRADVRDEEENSDYDDVYVYVQETSANNPPVLQGIPDQTTEIGEGAEVDLWDYTYDVEDSDSELDFTLDSQSNTGVISCWISGDRYVLCDDAEQLGQSALTVRVTDTGSAWDTDTFVIRVTGDCPYCENEPPEIESIDIDPDDPEDDDDITCEVHVEDEDGNLDFVEFRWYVDGDLERTRTRDVSGYSDTAEDTLDSSYTDEGDEVECRATVEDDEGEEDQESESVEVEENGDKCRIDIYDLEVEDEEDIVFRIINRGDDDEEVRYKIYVDGDKVEDDEIDIDEDDSERIRFEYDDFDEGEEYEIRIWARADCGDTDEEEVTYVILGDCDPEWLDSYRCSGNWLQRKYKEPDCDLVWKNWQYCSQGCSGSRCIGIPGPVSGCSLNIDNFDYSKTVSPGGTGFVSATVRNTGSYTEEFSTDFYLDGTYLGSKRFTLSPGQSAKKLWNFNVYGTGSRTVGITVYSECGASDSREGAINVGAGPSPGVCNYNQVCEAGESWYSCPYDCPKPGPEPGPTQVDIGPGSLDIILYKSKVISIDISSSQRQDFGISVEGVPQDWLSYEQTVEAEGERTAYVFINPKERGKYTLVVRVEALTEGLTFTEGVDVFVAQAEKPAAWPGDSVTGALIEVACNIYTIVIIIIIAAALVAWFGTRRLKSEEETTFDKR
jgi:hypothetical protein